MLQPAGVEVGEEPDVLLVKVEDLEEGLRSPGMRVCSSKQGKRLSTDLAHSYSDSHFTVFYMLGNLP